MTDMTRANMISIGWEQWLISVFHFIHGLTCSTISSQLYRLFVFSSLIILICFWSTAI